MVDMGFVPPEQVFSHDREPNLTILKLNRLIRSSRYRNSGEWFLPVVGEIRRVRPSGK
jgi:hypothetical protein